MIQSPFLRPTATSTRAAETVQQTFLDRIVRVRVSDGRIFQGQFLCVDSSINVILQGASQYRSKESDVVLDPQSLDVAVVEGIVEKQWVGMIMIPGKHLDAISVQEEQKAQPKQIYHPTWSSNTQESGSTGQTSLAFPSDSSLYM